MKTAIAVLILTFGLAAEAKPRHPTATFKNSSVKLHLSEHGVGVRLQGSRSKVGEFAMITTLGESDFHIVYSPDDYGFQIETVSKESSDKIVALKSLFAKNAKDMTETGISCDLRSPYSVLQYERSDTGARFAFKILEFRIDEKFDSKPVRYLRLFVNANGTALPLDVSSIPMSAMIPQGTSENFDAEAYLKKNFINLEKGSWGEMKIGLASGKGYKIQIEGENARLMKDGEKVSLEQAWYSYGEKLEKLDPKELVTSKTEIDRLVSKKNEVISETPLKKIFTKMNHIEIFEKLEKETYALGDPRIVPVRAAFKNSYYHAVLNHHGSYLPFVQFNYTEENMTKVREIMSYYLDGSFYDTPPRGQALMLDLRKLDGHLPENLFSDYAQLFDAKESYSLVVTDGKKIRLYFVLPGSKVSIFSLLEMDPKLACNASLRKNMHSNN